LFTDLSPDEVLTEWQGMKSETYLGLKIILSAFVLFLGFLFLRKTFKADNVEEGIDSKNIFIGSHSFDTVNLELELGETKEQLTSKESDLLLLLHRHVNEIVKREEILKSVWGDEGDYVGRTLDVFISKLRKRFQEDQNIKIVNVRGVGYKLIINTP
jgi:DNA-binding response OmpR family regulator